MRLGARGYVTKNNAPETLSMAVSEVAAGKHYLSADIATSLAILRLAGDVNPLKVLSAREFEIFRQLVAGRTTPAIAKALNISCKTVSNHHTLIKHKLGVATDMQLVLLAVRHALV